MDDADVPSHIRFCSSGVSLRHLLNNTGHVESTTTPSTEVKDTVVQESPVNPVVAPVFPGIVLQYEPDPQELVTLDVHAAQFVPHEYWLLQKRIWTVRELMTSYFRLRTAKHATFQYKLANALKLTASHPDLFRVIGVMWVTDRVIMVNKSILSKLLGVGKATTAIFSTQGVFLTHGFVEVPPACVNPLFDRIPNYNHGSCKFFTRPDGKFSARSSEDEISVCRYIPPKR